MQYKVPQNVDIEDKVIAGLTLRQFTFLMVAGGAVLSLYYLLPEAIKFLFMPLGLVIGGAGVALAFVKVNDRPLEVFIISAAKTVITPSKRVWKKEIIAEDQKKEVVKKEEALKEKKNVEEIRTNLERLAMVVDSGSHGLADDRITNVKANEDNSIKVSDILNETEKGSERINKLLENARSIAGAKKIEPTIGQISSQNVTKDQFKYEELGLKDEKELEKIVSKATQKQKEKEAAIERATIIKH